jgi:putative DNA primase/helicase
MSKEEISYKNIAEEVAQSIATKLDDRPTPHKFARVLTEELKQRIPIRTFLKEDRVIGTFIYDGGIYREGEKDLEAIFDRVMALLGMENRSRRYMGYKSDFMSILKSSTYTNEEFNEKLILYHDIVVDWDAFIHEREPFAFPPSPDLNIVHRVPWRIDLDVLKNEKDKEYDEVKEDFRDPQKGTVISKFFEEWAGDKWPLLLELIGYSLLAGEYPLHKATMLLGEGSNGKSTYLYLAERLIGEENTSHVSLQDLSSESGRFMRCYLFHKMVNIYADLPRYALKETGAFKMLTGEDVILADRKHKDPIYFRSYAKLMFSTNELPKIHDLSYAFSRRWNLVEFPHKFEENEGIKKVIDELLSREAGRILAFGLLAIKNVMVRGEFSFQEEAGSIKERWLRETDPIYNFVKTGMEQGWLSEETTGRAEKKELYNLYVKFLDVEELGKPAEPKTFTERMEEMGYPLRQSGPTRYYAGIRIVRERLPSDYAEFRRGIE